MFYYLIDVCAVLCALACLSRLRSWRWHKSHPSPPGPNRLPLIGNMLDMKDPELWEAAQKWGQQYGPLVSVEAVGKKFIFVNSYKIAVDLFEKRGSIYSSRPKFTMLDLEGWDWFVPVMPYGDELRRSRQLLHRFLQPAMMDNYAELQTQFVHKMLDGLLTRPDNFRELLRQAMGEIIISATYGYQAREKNDPYVELAKRGVIAVTKAEELWLVNLFPSLRYLPSWFPGTGFKKVAEEGYKASMAMYNDPYEMAKKKMNDGTGAASIVSKLHEASTSGDTAITDEALIKKVTGVTYAAGADTTVAALASFFLAMLLNPEAQRRAQDELDRVVGKDTLPSLNDRPNLPYLEAVIKETFRDVLVFFEAFSKLDILTRHLLIRWQAVTPLGAPHMAEADNYYDGYFISSGTILFANIWAMLRDPEQFPEPDKFIPERWLPDEGREPPVDVNNIFFGFGRRICPGRHFADSTVFIGAASILAAFNITKAQDEKGVPITPKAEYEPSFLRHPRPFDYVLSPRTEKTASIIRQVVESST